MKGGYRSGSLLFFVFASPPPAILPLLLLSSSTLVIEDPGFFLFPFFVFVPAADAANGKRHEMAPLQKRGEESQPFILSANE